jgi:hypothetical protein
MFGLRVVPIFRYPAELLGPGEGPVRPAPRLSAHQGSEFSFYFGGILPRLSWLVWFADEDAFQFPLEWLFNEDAGGSDPFRDVEQRRTWIAQQGDRAGTRTVIDPNWILQPGFVQDYARFVSDDWNSLYGFGEPPANWRTWMKGRGRGELAARARFLEATIEVCFFSIDGAYWEVFARDRDLVEQVRQELGGVAGLRLEQAALETSAGV